MSRSPVEVRPFNPVVKVLRIFPSIVSVFPMPIISNNATNRAFEEKFEECADNYHLRGIANEC